MLSIFLSASIGDFFALESFFSDKFREELTTIYYATTKEKDIKTLFKSIPEYKDVEHKVIWDDFKKFNCFLYKSDCLQLMEYRGMEITPSFVESEDYGILTVFPKLKPEDYNYSSFLRHHLCDIGRALPERFMVICPYGCKDHPDRNFSEQDWQMVVDFLKKRNITGVILNNLVESVAIHENLVDLSGKTTLMEAVEILKKSSGYIGVDSSLSVLAAKLFSPEDIIIKTTNMQVIHNRHIYYAPQTTFNFLELAV